MTAAISKEEVGVKTTLSLMATSRVQDLKGGRIASHEARPYAVGPSILVAMVGS